MQLIYPINGIQGKAQISDKKIYISQGFGENPETYKQFGHKGHNGIDIAAPAGTPIIASHDGSLQFLKDLDKNGKLQGYGNYARLTFDEDGYGWEVINCHMSKFQGSNRKVKQGEVIGYVGTTGFSTGNHDHFGLKQFKNGRLLNANNGFGGSIDPTKFISKKGETLQLVKDGGTTYLTGGKNVKFKIGISEPYVLGIFGDEEVGEADLSHIKTEYTLSQGFVITKK